MSLLTTTDDAEQVATTWMQKRYGKRLGKVKFIEVMREDGVWNVKVSAKLATGVLLFKKHLIQLKIDSGSTDVVGYTEAEMEDKAE
jgi:hypothetical protein